MENRRALLLLLMFSLLLGACAKGAGDSTGNVTPADTKPPDSWNNISWNESDWG